MSIMQFVIISLLQGVTECSDERQQQFSAAAATGRAMSC